MKLLHLALVSEVLRRAFNFDSTQSPDVPSLTFKSEVPIFTAYK